MADFEYPDKIKDLKAKCIRINFFKEDTNYTIAVFESIDEDGQIPIGEKFSLKGTFVVSLKEPVTVSGNLDRRNKQYEGTYYLEKMTHGIDFSNANQDDMVQYLSFLTSEHLANELYQAYGNDVIDILDNNDIEKLKSIRGIGEAVASNILEKHNSKIDYSEAYLALCKPYGLTEKAVTGIVNHYKNDTKLAIKRVNDNPYNLTEMNGWGFRKADEAFLKFNKFHPDSYRDKRRVIAYVAYLFEEEYAQGNTWITPMQLIQKVVEFIPESDKEFLVEYVKESEDYRIIQTQKDVRITTAKNFKEEMEIASLILEKVDSNYFASGMEDVEETIELVEKEQGFEFDSVQREAIKKMSSSGIYLLQGLSGAGKSSSIKALVRIFENNHKMIGQVALSGKAAKNLENITGRNASTIHKLLMVGTDIEYSEKNKLPHDVMIIDEISMVPNEIFLKLLKSLKPEARVIMVGDLGQLPSIGVGPADGIVNSNIVPNTTLKKIHRQAQKSAITTHSIFIRSGEKPKELDYSKEVGIYGELQDMKYHFVDYSDEDKVVELSIDYYAKLLEENDVSDVSIIATNKRDVLRLNKLAQYYANPKDSRKAEIHINTNENEYTLRVGDRVMNVKNNYNTYNHEGYKTPVFNGNTGTIINIEKKVFLPYGKTEDLYATIDFDGVDRVVMPLYDKDDSIQLGYAGTVNKNQGSTLKHIVVSYPFHYMLNSRESLYTAITRASKSCTLITSPKTFASAYKKSVSKVTQTNLQLMLQHYDKLKNKL